MSRKINLPIIALVLVIASFPITIFLVNKVQDYRSSASAPDKLEMESGILSSSGVSKQNDPNASGGQSILFQNQINTPTPTSIVQSKGPIGPQPVTSTPLSQGTKFAAPNGSGTACTQASPCSLATVTGNAAPGDVVFFRGGIYQITQNIYFGRNASAASPITFESYPGEWAIFDGSTLSAGTQIYIRVTGTYNKLRKFEIRNMPMQGIWIGSNYNTLDGLHVHHNKLSGIHIFSPYEAYPYGQYGSYNQILNSKVNDNSDANLGGAGQDFNRGGNADGISISSGEGNIVKNSLSEHNSDDGIDTWRSTNTRVSYSISTNNGIDQGNGNAFKAGGASPSNGTIVERSIAYNNRSLGFDTNSGLNVTFNYVTSWNNDSLGFYTYATTKVSNSISYQDSGFMGGNGTATNNSWQRSGTPAFISTDPTSPNFLKPIAGGGFENIGAYAN